MGYEKIFILFILFSFVITGVKGFGIASSYLENNVMTLSPGETRDYQIELQNVDISMIKAKLFLDSNITKVAEEQEYYLIGNNTPIKDLTLIITAPADAQPGQEFIVKYGAYPISAPDAPVGLSIRLNKEFTVRISGEVAENIKSNDQNPIITLGIVLLGLSLVFVLLNNLKFSKKVFK